MPINIKLNVGSEGSSNNIVDDTDGIINVEPSISKFSRQIRKRIRTNYFTVRLESVDPGNIKTFKLNEININSKITGRQVNKI